MEFQSTNNLYGFPQPLTRVFPAPVIAQRAPTTADYKYQIGQQWVDEVGDDAYILVDVTNNTATWNVTATTPGNVDTLTTDTGGAITPSAGNINVLGDATQGLTGSGAASTITFTIADASETQKGVLELATNAESIAGTDAVRGIVPTSLKAKLGAQTANGLSYGGGTTAAVNWLGAATNGQIPVGSTGSAPVLAAITGSPEITVTNGAGTIALTSKVGGASVSGAKFTLSAGTFSITPNDAGTMTFVTPSNVTPGNFVRTNTATPATFIDANGASTIAGALFGFKTTDAMEAASPYPFFLYMALDNTDANPAYFITNIGGRQNINSTAIGKTGSAATAATWGDFFALGNPTTANYSASNLVYVGCFRMLKSNNDWAVQTLGVFDGVGLYPDNTYLFSRGTLNAVASSIFASNAGTEPTLTANTFLQWTFAGPDAVSFKYGGTIAGTPAGANAVEVIIPFRGGSGAIPMCYGSINSGGTVTPIFGVTGTASTPQGTFAIALYDATGAAILNTDFTNGDDFSLFGTILIGNQ